MRAAAAVFHRLSMLPTFGRTPRNAVLSGEPVRRERRVSDFLTDRTGCPGVLVLFGLHHTFLIISWNVSLANKNEFQLDSFFEIKTKSLEPGVKKSFKLLGEDSVVDIGEVSGIATDLLRSRYLFPPFFVYVYREKELTNQELREIRASLGIHMWGAIHDWLKSQGG